MYGKVFESIYEGTLYGQWEALVTFQQMIVLCDKEGFIEITPMALAARTSIPLDIIQKGIEVLESDDPYSRTEGNDGRRIIRIRKERPWGWKIVNHKKYRDMVCEEDRRKYMREYMREYRKKGANVNDESLQNANSKQPLTMLTHTDTDTDNKYSPFFREFWKYYPHKKGKKSAYKAWNKIPEVNSLLPTLISAIKNQIREKENLIERNQFCPEWKHPATWLNGECWEDEIDIKPEQEMVEI